jgi:hypothetical protein
LFTGLFCFLCAQPMAAILVPGSSAYKPHPAALIQSTP